MSSAALTISLPSMLNGAVLRLLQAGYYTQRGGFCRSRTGRAASLKSSVFNREVYILQNVVLTVEFINMLQFKFCSFSKLLFPVIPCGSTAHALRQICVAKDIRQCVYQEYDGEHDDCHAVRSLRRVTVLILECQIR